MRICILVLENMHTSLSWRFLLELHETHTGIVFNCRVIQLQITASILSLLFSVHAPESFDHKKIIFELLNFQSPCLFRSSHENIRQISCILCSKACTLSFFFKI